MLTQEILVRCDTCLVIVDHADYVYVVETPTEDHVMLCRACYYLAKRMAKSGLFGLVVVKEWVSAGALLDNQARLLSEDWEQYPNPRTSSIWRLVGEKLLSV